MVFSGDGWSRGIRPKLMDIARNTAAFGECGRVSSLMAALRAHQPHVLVHSRSATGPLKRQNGDGWSFGFFDAAMRDCTTSSILMQEMYPCAALAIIRNHVPLRSSPTSSGLWERAGCNRLLKRRRRCAISFPSPTCSLAVCFSGRRADCPTTSKKSSSISVNSSNTDRKTWLCNALLNRRRHRLNLPSLCRVQGQYTRNRIRRFSGKRYVDAVCGPGYF